MKYKDDKGNVLYGFSQENLERTNKEIRRTNRYMQTLIILFIIFLAVFISFLVWLEINNVFTRLIYG
ncbi:MAG: hypothetical protein AABY07_07050 [Nanoarchaeota archaeon]